MSAGYVYILCNDRRTVLYTGSIGDLRIRIIHYKRWYIPGFTQKYNVDRLIYFEECLNVSEAKSREKQIKGFCRARLSRDFVGIG